MNERFVDMRSKIADTTNVRIVSSNFVNLYKGKIGFLPLDRYANNEIMCICESTEGLFIRLKIRG